MHANLSSKLVFRRVKQGLRIILRIITMNLNGTLLYSSCVNRCMVTHAPHCMLQQHKAPVQMPSRIHAAAFCNMMPFLTTAVDSLVQLEVHTAQGTLHLDTQPLHK